MISILNTHNRIDAEPYILDEVRHDLLVRNVLHAEILQAAEVRFILLLEDTDVGQVDFLVRVCMVSGQVHECSSPRMFEGLNRLFVRRR